MSPTPELMKETADYVMQYLTQHLPAACVFHDLSRTLKVVRHCDTLGIEMELPKGKRSLLHLAAWFQDIGYAVNPAAHEQAGAAEALRFFTEKGLDGESIQDIQNCILATRSPQQPQNLMAQILCDADCYHLADKHYERLAALQREELLRSRGQSFTDEEWTEAQRRLFDSHSYYTSAARKLFEKGKNRNRAVIEKAQAGSTGLEVSEKTGEAPDPTFFDISIRLERGVETLFRVTSRKQVELTNMADNKANLVISINTILISIILSVLVTKLEDNRHLIIPTLLMILTSVCSMIIAILATRPKLIGASKQDVVNEEGNILFFGFFQRLPLPRYKQLIHQTLLNKNKLYSSLTEDIYYQGIVLTRKYRYVALAYNVFMVGLVISILAFVAALIPPMGDGAIVTRTAAPLNQHYLMQQPEAVWELPLPLKEISGIAWQDSSTLLCVEDESGIVYRYSLASNSIVQEIPFGPRGDYEDLVLAGDSVFVLRSDGTIFLLADFGEEDMAVSSIQTGLSIRNNAEGLYYDAQARRLLIACKGFSGVESADKSARAVYAFDLDSYRLVNPPHLLLTEADLSPSAIAVHPVSHSTYLLSSPGKRLLELTAQGQILSQIPLEDSRFTQPEGLCFAPNGDLFISNEGRGGRGNILRFRRRP